ncbi:ejaculatory bulb-specific protein 3-like isoform X1 [Danaus plexippus]|uniref:ejaculatory bulb-specific protein 3-like isoform X1 n=1 Tax=Danaus plexippus TaxID=13037 RepID=UPI002AB0630F|nr:ejaculatory bulb-specific protein 3-like isoform X1 [Danaus plexippus]
MVINNYIKKSCASDSKLLIFFLNEEALRATLMSKQRLNVELLLNLMFKMKSVMILALFAFVAADKDYYVLDKIDLSKIENNIEELKIFMDCVLDKGTCSDLYNSYKVHIDESFKTACGKCTPEQKQFVSQFFKLYRKVLPQDIEDFINKYDPERKYIDDLLAEVDKYNV